MDGDWISSPRTAVGLVLLLSLGTVALLPRLALSPMGRRLARGLEGLSADAVVWRTAALVCLAAVFLLVSTTSSHYGYNVDEWFQARYGREVVDWYAQTLAGNRTGFSARIEEMNYYGALFELLAELATRISPLDHTATRHLVTAWFGVLGLAAAYLLGATLHSRAAGLGVVLLLVLSPRLYGHFFANSKDVSFATCMVFALVAVCRALPALPRLRAGQVLLVGAGIGVAMGVRVNGGIALAYFGLGVAWCLAAALWRGRGRMEPGDLLALCVGGLGVAAVSWLVMLLFWPWAQSAPLTGPFRALGYFDDIVGAQKLDFPVFFEGLQYKLSTVPRYFTLKWLLISAPETALLAPVIGIAAWLWWRGREPGFLRAREMAWGVLVVSIGVPLAMTADPTLIQYDGIRHFLFLVPAFGVLLAASFVAVLGRPGAARWKAGLCAAMVGLAGITAYDMARLHPYEYLYFNRTIAGGLGEAGRSHETDYLGMSYREGVRWMLANVDPGPQPPMRVAGCGGFRANLVDGLEAAGLDSSRFRVARRGERPQLALAITRGGCQERFPGPVLGTVEREGIPLLYVIRIERAGRR